METSDSKKYKFDARCPVCGNIIKIDGYGNGDVCPKCSWDYNEMNEEFPDRVICPNLIPLNKAKKLYKENKPFIPDFEDFISGFNFYGEMEFTYKGVIYGLVGIAKEGVEFYSTNTGEYKVFKDIEEFKQKAQIDGKLVKDIWNKVTNTNWLQ